MGDDAALGCGVGRLADLTVEGGDGCGVDDDPPLAVDRFGGGDGGGSEADDVEASDEVDLDDAPEALEVEWALGAQGPCRISDSGAVDDDPQITPPGRDVDGGPHLIGFAYVGADESDAIAKVAQAVQIR